MIWVKKTFKILVYIFALIGLIFVAVFFAMKFHFTNTRSIVDTQNAAIIKSVEVADTTWKQGEEWETLKKAIIKDAPTITKASLDAGIPARTIVSSLIVEQLRLFHDNREIFKQVFAPLSILGNQSQFSWGVMGIKQETAQKIEENIGDKTSVYYPDISYEHILDFTTPDHDTERFNRLSDEHNHYYSYLYAGLYMKEIESQWQKAGFDISKRPEILATLFNIGFEHSQPSLNPHMGGAVITINTKDYSFGALANLFYTSDELTDYFPH